MFRQLAEEYTWDANQVSLLTIPQAMLYLQDVKSNQSVFRRSKKFSTLAQAFKWAEEHKK